MTVVHGPGAHHRLGGGQLQGDFPSHALAPHASCCSARPAGRLALDLDYQVGWAIPAVRPGKELPPRPYDTNGKRSAQAEGRRREDGSPKGQDPACFWPGLGSRQPPPEGGTHKRENQTSFGAWPTRASCQPGHFRRLFGPLLASHFSRYASCEGFNSVSLGRV